MIIGLLVVQMVYDDDEDFGEILENGEDPGEILEAYECTARTSELMRTLGRSLRQ